MRVGATGSGLRRGSKSVTGEEAHEESRAHWIPAVAMGGTKPNIGRPHGLTRRTMLRQKRSWSTAGTTFLQERSSSTVRNDVPSGTEFEHR